MICERAMNKQSLSFISILANHIFRHHCIILIFTVIGRKDLEAGDKKNIVLEQLLTDLLY